MEYSILKTEYLCTFIEFEIQHCTQKAVYNQLYGAHCRWSWKQART